MTVQASVLRRQRARGHSSAILEARLAYSEIEGVARYVRGMARTDRVFPSMRPTQVSGRWSTTEPPLVNFPAYLRGGTREGVTPAPLVIPDPGEAWVSWDWSALHARIAAAYVGDPVELEAFNHGHDVHTLTACGMWRVPLPPLRTKACHTDPTCAEWRASWQPPWGGEDDKRRRLAKVMRYATLLGRDARAVLESPDIEREGLTRGEALQYATMYLASRPLLTAAKTRIFQQCAKTGEARTFMGFRRRLYGDYWTRAKNGWSHILQGAESDMMATCLIEISQQTPEATLILNSHDGAIWSLPRLSALDALSRWRPLVERRWIIHGTLVHTPADWKYWLPDGTVVKPPSSQG